MMFDGDEDEGWQTERKMTSDYCKVKNWIICYRYSNCLTNMMPGREIQDTSWEISWRISLIHHIMVSNWVEFGSMNWKPYDWSSDSGFQICDDKYKRYTVVVFYNYVCLRLFLAGHSGIMEEYSFEN